MAQTDCRRFNGYRPCTHVSPVNACSATCPHYEAIQHGPLLLVHLGAQGAVVRSTALLRALRRKFPARKIFWVTDPPLHELLAGHPLIDRVFNARSSEIAELQAYAFSVACVVDKSVRAAALVRPLRFGKWLGFMVDPTTGAVLPSTEAARELWEIGLSDHRKFVSNEKSEAQLVHEALELGPWQRDEYDLHLRDDELKQAQLRRADWTQSLRTPVIGLNTGCSATIPAKKWTIGFHRQVIQMLQREGYRNLVLLGGPEDHDRNEEIAQGLAVPCSPMLRGVRDGAISVAACDMVITGDTFGLHLGIAFRKFVIGWFGPTVSREIEFYGRGVALAAEVTCSPCWKRKCHKEVMCYDRVPLTKILAAVELGKNRWSEEIRKGSMTPQENLCFPTSETFHKD